MAPLELGWKARTEAELALMGRPGVDEGWPADVSARDLSDSPFLLVTRGPEGATFRRVVDSPPHDQSVPVPGGPLSGDPTGCGDVWGAVVFCGLVEGLPLREAMLRGHQAAAVKLTRPRMDGLADALARALVPASDS